MIPRPSWLAFLGQYLRLIMVAVLFLLLVAGVPLALVLAFWCHR
jgi:hypothetical protein